MLNMVIVAAVDRSDRAQNVINHAEEVSEAFGDEIHVVHVLKSSEFVDLERTNVNESGKPIDMPTVRETAAEIAETIASNLTRPSKPVGLVGNPADRIVDYADKQEARYIVIAGRKRSPAAKVLFGSVGQDILLNATSPVINVTGPASTQSP